LTRLVFWGGTGQAKVLREAVAGRGTDLAIVFDNDPDISSPFPEIPLLHGWAAFEKWRAGVDVTNYLAAVAIGGDRGRQRIDIGRRLAGYGLQPTTIVHRSAYVATDVTVGAGCQILAGATVASQTTLGAWTIVNTAASIDHDCVADEGVHIAPGATVTGCVRIGPAAMIGAGAVIAPRVTIGADAVVGAGSVVLEDVRPGTVVVGSPARFLRKITL